jgi:chorismate mutase
MENSLAKKRKKIDALDARLAGLLAERFSVVMSLAGLKKKIRDPRREAAVLKRAAGLVKDKKLRPAVTAVYGEIIRQSRLLQKRS